jgi:hypothetical protein
VRLRDLQRYMGIVGAEVRMPRGEPWRVGKRSYGRSGLSTAAACPKWFHLRQAALGATPRWGGRWPRLLEHPPADAIAAAAAPPTERS